MLTSVPILVTIVMVPLLAVSTSGSAVFATSLSGFRNTIERGKVEAIARPFVVTKDSTISPTMAGQSYFALQPERTLLGSVRLQAQQPRQPRPWTNNPPASGLFVNGLRSSPWIGPHPGKILEAVSDGFSAGEMDYLRRIATAPVWRDWEIVARARVGDIYGTSLALPFADDASWTEVPIPRFSAMRDLAYASNARAAYHLALHRPDSAEAALRQTISVGFFISDNSNSAIEGILGVIITGIGRDALIRLHALTGNAAGRALRASHDSANLVREAREVAVQLASGFAGNPRVNTPTLRRRLLHVVTDANEHRVARMEYLMLLGLAPCTNLRELVFGPDQEIRDAFAQARRELAHSAADSAIIDLAETSGERGISHEGRVAMGADQSLRMRLLIGASSIAGTVLQNRRLRGCAEWLSLPMD